MKTVINSDEDKKNVSGEYFKKLEKASKEVWEGLITQSKYCSLFKTCYKYNSVQLRYM
jgi:hypothetical protein